MIKNKIHGYVLCNTVRPQNNERIFLIFLKFWGGVIALAPETTVAKPLV